MLFRYNDQQWFNTDHISTIDDFGFHMQVTLMTGRSISIQGSQREEFFRIILSQNDTPPRAG